LPDYVQALLAYIAKLLADAGISICK